MSLHNSSSCTLSLSLSSSLTLSSSCLLSCRHLPSCLSIAVTLSSDCRFPDAFRSLHKTLHQWIHHCSAYLSLSANSPSNSNLLIISISVCSPWSQSNGSPSLILSLASHRTSFRIIVAIASRTLISGPNLRSLGPHFVLNTTTRATSTVATLVPRSTTWVGLVRWSLLIGMLVTLSSVSTWSVISAASVHILNYAFKIIIEFEIKQLRLKVLTQTTIRLTIVANTMHKPV